jgi:hypothetical protein
MFDKCLLCAILSLPTGQNAGSLEKTAGCAMPIESPIVRGLLPGATRSIAKHHQNLKKEHTDPKRFGKAHGTCKDAFQVAASGMDVSSEYV